MSGRLFRAALIGFGGRSSFRIGRTSRVASEEGKNEKKRSTHGSGSC